MSTAAQRLRDQLIEQLARAHRAARQEGPGSDPAPRVATDDYDAHFPGEPDVGDLGAVLRAAHTADLGPDPYDELARAALRWTRTRQPEPPGAADA